LYREFIESVIEANKEIYKYLKESDDSTLYKKSGFVGMGGDESKEIDLYCERVFLSKLYHYGKIISEESGEVGDSGDIIWIDPLDGSDNFLSKIPYYGSSVALESSRGVEVGIIANFANGDIFVKSCDSFKVSKLDSLEFKDVRVNQNSTVGIFERAYRSKIYAKKLSDNLIKYRMPGAIALSLAYAHYVDFIVLEDKLRDFDVKAGMKMCENLYKYQYNDLTLICKDESRFLQIKKILLEE